jgi:hypothetical protein
MSRPSVAQTLERLQDRPADANEEHFYTRLAPGTPAHRVLEAGGEKGPGATHISCCRRQNSQAESDLHWRYCHAASELGERSAHDSLVYRIQVGGGNGSAALVIDAVLEEQFGERFTTARAISPQAIWAADKLGRIIRGLKCCSREHNAVLEMRFSARKENPQILGLCSAGGMPKLEPVVTYLYRCGRIKIRKDGKVEDLDKILEEAAQLDASAIAAYELAAGLKEPPPKREPRQRAMGPLVARGAMGASKRAIVPVECPRDL